MKKIVSIALAVCVILSICVLSVYADMYGVAEDSFKVTYGGKSLPLSGYNPGEGAIYFSKDGQACSYHKDGSCSNCKVYGGAKQCLGFAFYVQNQLFGGHYQNSTKLNIDKYDIIKNFDDNSEDKESSIKALFLNVRLGAHVRTKAGHSMIFAASNENYIWTYEANVDYHCRVRLKKRTWLEMYQYIHSKRLNYIASPKIELFTFKNTAVNNNVIPEVEKTETTEKQSESTDKSCWWHISYNSNGYCKKCGSEFDMDIKSMSKTSYQAVKNDVPVRNRPYSPDAIIKYLSKGTKVTVVASGKNAAGNLWYKLSDNSWVYSKNLEKVKEEKPAPSTLDIDVTQYPTIINQGKSFGLRGNINSNYNVTSVKGYIINSSGTTVVSTSDSPDEKSNNIRYLNLNEDMIFGELSVGNYTLKIVAKDSSGERAEWSNGFTVKGEEKKNKPVEIACSHTYNKSGYCSKCSAEYSISLSSVNETYEAVKNDVPVRNRPYSPDTIIKYLSKGTKVTVAASGKNSVGNLWYKLSDGTWIYSGNLTKSSAPTSSSSNTTSIRFELETVPKGKLPYGKSFSLRGWFRSDSAIVEARAYILDADKNVVMQSEKASSTTSNYKIQGYKLDKSMKFGKLSPGGYYLKYYVRDANGDTATWISDMFYIVK